MDNLFYLKQNVVIEPLVDQWYAWAHLISPATAAKNIEGRHLKILNSFIKSPKVHEAAVKNPKMLGGPFMDIPASKMDGVVGLTQRTTKERAHMIKLSKAFKELDSMLENVDKGYSLEGYYKQVPDILKGYVELVYDLNNNPSYRIYEQLLYNSEYYNTSSQSIALWLTENDDRPFVLSTPRLDTEDVLHIPMPFNSDWIDRLASMKHTPAEICPLKEALDLSPEQELFFDSLFTKEIPETYSEYTGDKIRMRYFGHACVLIETSNTSILIDPVISYYGYQTEVSRYSENNLPKKIDYVLITHNHQDHILFETLLPLRHRIGKLVIPKSTSGSLQDPNLKLMFNNIGFENILELDVMEVQKYSDVEITGIPFIGEHCDLNIQSKLCFHVNISDFSILFVADSCNLTTDLYHKVQNQIGDIDVLLLGMECDGAPLTWLYGPLLSKEISRKMSESRRLAGCNYQRGIDLVDIFNPQEVYVYAMGMEPWLKFISSIKYSDQSNPIIDSNKLIEECKARGIVSDRLFGEREFLYPRKRKRQKQEI